MSNLKIKLLKLLLNSTFKYNKTECKEKWFESVGDEVRELLTDKNI